MARQNQGLTWTFNLRATAEEERIIRDLVAKYAECGVTLSLNEVVRLVIRYGWKNAAPGPECRPGGARPVAPPAAGRPEPAVERRPAPPRGPAIMPFGVFPTEP